MAAKELQYHELGLQRQSVRIVIWRGVFAMRALRKLPFQTFSEDPRGIV